MKRKLSILLTALCLFALLTACRAAQAPGSGPADTAAPQTITEDARIQTEKPAETRKELSFDFAMDLVWRSEQEDIPGEGRLVRELILGDEGTYSIRIGDPDSEFSYWANGVWILQGDEITFLVREIDEDGADIPGTAPYEAVYGLAAREDQLSLTLRSARGFQQEQPPLVIVFAPQSDED